MTPPVARSAARPTILRLLAAMAAGNQLWEVHHVPLYTPVILSLMWLVT